jgi:hypothetical protein
MGQDNSTAPATDTAPDADVMKRVADALEATDGGREGEEPATIVVATDDAGPLLPRRGS